VNITNERHIVKIVMEVSFVNIIEKNQNVKNVAGVRFVNTTHKSMIVLYVHLKLLVEIVNWKLCQQTRHTDHIVSNVTVFLILTLKSPEDTKLKNSC
jgi:hypothetical protein